MIQKGRTGGDQFETSAVADQQMNWWVTDTDGRKDRGFRPDRAQGAHEHEAEEHDLLRVRGSTTHATQILSSLVALPLMDETAKNPAINPR
jgi:hypothetical protein